MIKAVMPAEAAAEAAVSGKRGRSLVTLTWMEPSSVVGVIGEALSGADVLSR